MNLLWEREKNTLYAFGQEIEVTNIVRNELNGWRQAHEIVYTIPAAGHVAVPYFPRQFPLGTWKITKVIKTNSPEYAPYFIATDAWQWVDQWKMRMNRTTGRPEYHKRSAQQVKDSGYGLHFARYFDGHVWRPSGTTLGCGNIKSEAAARTLGERLIEQLKIDNVYLIVE
jgi:hypothetical protein